MYYPKSKVLENQHTSGGELIDPSTGNTYSGFYHVTYDGNFYTGASHSISSQPLTGTPATSGSGSVDILVRPAFIANFEYDTASDSKMSYLFSYVVPDPIYPSPATADYQAGQFNRYFMKSVTTNRIQELSQQGYQDVQSNPLYTSLTLIWKLTGPLHDNKSNPLSIVYGVADTNARTLGMNEKNMKGISLYLSNLIELAQITK